MQAKSTMKPLPEVVAAIQSLDLESVKLRLMDAELGNGWTREYVNRIEAAYKNFLTVLAKYPEDMEDIQVSKDVDEFWHAHILQTRKYTQDCQTVFGTYLHHDPEIAPPTAGHLERRAIQAEKTKRLYELEFLGRPENGLEKDAGLKTNSSTSAYCAASAYPRDTAYCAATIRATAAYCAASVAQQEAAYCAASAQPRDTAYCAASIRENAAYCAASVAQQEAAYCAASAYPRDTAYCAASIRTNAAYCAAGVAQQQRAYCAASIDQRRSTESPRTNQ